MVVPSITCLGSRPFLADLKKRFCPDRYTRKPLMVHLFNIAGLPSVGLIASGINGLPWGTDAIALAISRDLFLQDADQFYSAFAGYEESDTNEAYDRLAI